MATKKKLLQAAAGQAGGAGLNVEEVFSTYLYDGTGGTPQSISNGIDLSGEGGLVWIKSRGGSYHNILYDTERGALKFLRSSQNIAETTTLTGHGLTAFNSDGFDIGSDWAGENVNYNIASWTFRKAPKFFDVVTYTGDGTSGREIAHNLGTTVGTILIKRLDTAVQWVVYHRSLSTDATYGRYSLTLNTTAAEFVSGYTPSEPTSTHFTISSNNQVNASGATYVAYLFAHNDGDGTFGPDGDADIIKCGSYTGNGSTNGPEIDLGWEPQWLLTKAASSTSDWHIWDAMRGVPTGGDDARLTPNTSEAEFQNYDAMSFLPTGFKLTENSSRTNASGVNYIYIAIRRGPMAVPESATDVFAIDTLGGTSPNPPGWNAGFPVDFAIRGNTASFAGVAEARLLGTKYLNTNGTNAENTSSLTTWDYMDGFFNSTSVSSNYYSWMWRRAPNYFDVVAYTGNDTYNRALEHNLTVAPEMIVLKARNRVDNWIVYHKNIGTGKSIYLNSTGTPNSDSSFPTTPTDSVFYLGAGYQDNGSTYNYIAYLFASLDGVSKVGSFSHTNGTDTNVDCGFSSGARFILIKQYDTAGNWWVFDTERGIVAGNDSGLRLNSTNAETLSDFIDPLSSGFTVVGANWSTGDHIFYAIA